jgi:hypothetical protein
MTVTSATLITVSLDKKTTALDSRMTRGTVINDVIEVVREASDLKKELKEITKDMNYIAGYHATYIEVKGNKKIFHECIIEEWNGSGWDAMSTDTDCDDDPEYFVITFKDIIDGNVNINFVCK